MFAQVFTDNTHVSVASHTLLKHLHGKADFRKGLQD